MLSAICDFVCEIVVLALIHVRTTLFSCPISDGLRNCCAWIRTHRLPVETRLSLRVLFLHSLKISVFFSPWFRLLFADSRTNCHQRPCAIMRSLFKSSNRWLSWTVEISSLFVVWIRICGLGSVFVRWLSLKSCSFFPSFSLSRKPFVDDLNSLDLLFTRNCVGVSRFAVVFCSFSSSPFFSAERFCVFLPFLFALSLQHCSFSLSRKRLIDDLISLSCFFAQNCQCVPSSPTLFCSFSAARFGSIISLFLSAAIALAHSQFLAA